MTRTCILVADGLAIFRSGVRKLLAHESEFEVREAATLDDVVRVTEQRCADIALIDLDLPPRGGLEAVRRVRASCDTDVIVWTFDPAPETVLAAVNAGASGFLDKRISPPGLVRALRGVVHGEAPLARDLAARMIDAIHAQHARREAEERAHVLSMREREILEYVANGARNRQIADALTISEFTVKRHVQNILHKLQLPSRRAAASFYRATYAWPPVKDGQPV